MRRHVDPNREAELRAEFAAEDLVLRAWGTHIVDVVSKAFHGRKSVVQTPFWAVDPSCRVKGIDSFIRKALYHPSKVYNDPMRQITDMVGARFVTLLQQDADQVIGFIMSRPEWDCVHDRNFREEVHDKPKEFDYFANHILVATRSPVEIGELEVPSGTWCEVQVRTLLQHAHSELTHDTTYKGVLKEDRDVVRRVARGAAMIESTDEIFELVADRMRTVREPVEMIRAAALEIYDSSLPGVRVDSPLDELLLESLLSHPPGNLSADNIRNYFRENEELLEAIESRKAIGDLYRVPAVLVAAYLADESPTYLDQVWPLSDGELDDLMRTIGISPENH